MVDWDGGLSNCNPNFNQSTLSTRTAWNPHPFLEIGLDVGWAHLSTANAGTALLGNFAAGAANPPQAFIGARPEVSTMSRTRSILHGSAVPEEHPALII